MTSLNILSWTKLWMCSNLYQRPSIKLLFNVIYDQDCPPFDGVFRFSQISAGGSLAAAAKLCNRESNIAINWSGGLHHARKCCAEGFCYVNDIVLSILELLKAFGRVLYIDVDVHHGDGVQEAFYTTNRVLTVSFHLFNNEFYPNRGSVEEIGVDDGKYCSVNVPLDIGVDDETFVALFKQVIREVMCRYSPDAIVFQAGADSLAGDPVGKFNLTTKGHAECLKFVKDLSIPMLVLGGGGYNVNNVAKCWTVETAVLVDQVLDLDKPLGESFHTLKASDELRVKPDTETKNKNSKKYIQNLSNLVLAQLSLIDPPSVQFHSPPPLIGCPGKKEVEEDM